MTLDQLALRHGSDKSSRGHSYMPFYERVLPKNPKSILEIGVLKGASMKMWRDYFPGTQLYGLDLFIENPYPFEDDCVTWLKGSQSDERMLEHIRHNIRPQVIIEDASHNCIAHWVTLFSLISCCEIYIIEDLHTCSDKWFMQGLAFDQTVLGAIKNNRFPFRYELYNDKIVVVYPN